MARKNNNAAQAPVSNSAIAAAFADALETAWRKRPSKIDVAITTTDMPTNNKRSATVDGAPITRVTISAVLPMPVHAPARFNKLQTSDAVGDDVKHAAAVAIARAVARAIEDGAHGIITGAAIGNVAEARTANVDGVRVFADTVQGRAIMACGCPAAVKAGHAVAGLYDVAKQAEIYAAQDAATAQLADAAAALKSLGMDAEQLAELLKAATA